MYRDIIENDKFGDSLKLNYHRIIVDVISVINHASRNSTNQEREIGRELRSHELVRPADSIRRAKIYIESSLDNKFIPDASRGINHIKHNLSMAIILKMDVVS